MDSLSQDSDQQAQLNAQTTKRENTVYDKEALQAHLEKLTQIFNKPFKNKAPKWSERLIVVSEDSNIEILDSAGVNNDVQREVQFYNICIENIRTGLQRISDEGLMLDRPQDYYADMFKPDEVMTKIRSSLVKQQVRVKNYEEQQLKKYSKRLQKQRRHEKNLEMSKKKRQNNVAIKKWQKDIKSKGGSHLVADLDDYIKKETMKRSQKKGYQNLKSKRIQKRNRPGKNARMKNFNRKKSRMGRK